MLESLDDELGVGMNIGFAGERGEKAGGVAAPAVEVLGALLVAALEGFCYWVFGW